MTGVSILGATGSIGGSTLDVITRHAHRYRVVAMSANRDVERMAALCLEHRPNLVAMADRDSAARLEARLAGRVPHLHVLAGEEGLEAVATHGEADVVMAAIVGAAGLPPTLAAVRAGKRILLANKESLVMAGALFMEEVARAAVAVLPIDSEHNAVFQCLPPDYHRDPDAHGVERVLLTASGGPFRDWPAERLKTVTPEQACNHPNWAMGRKISVDSATLMNKGLEVIEAHWLFGMPPDRIEVVVHPQSVIHSLVRYVDGSVLAQLGNPDMRTPIAHALAWPQRMTSGVEPLDLFQVGRLDFERPDLERFPCLGLAYEALETGGTAPALLNAANEVAVEAFLAGELPFTAIARILREVLERIPAAPADSLEVLFEADRRARLLARELVGGLA